MKQKIYINGKLLGDVEVEGLDLQSSKPSSDFKKGPFTVSASFKETEMSDEFLEIFKKLNEEYEKAMEDEKKLNKLLLEVGKILPTLFIIGSTKDKRGALFMGSPEEDIEKRAIDVASSIAMMMEARQDAKEVLLSALCYYLEKNPEDRVKMYDALNKMQTPKAEA